MLQVGLVASRHRSHWPRSSRHTCRPTLCSWAQPAQHCLAHYASEERRSAQHRTARCKLWMETVLARPVPTRLPPAELAGTGKAGTGIPAHKLTETTPLRPHTCCAQHRTPCKYIICIPAFTTTHTPWQVFCNVQCQALAPATPVTLQLLAFIWLPSEHAAVRLTLHSKPGP